MSVTTEYSRILVKRSTVPGVEPTIPTASTIDNTWVSTDLLVGEIFMNTADDRVWMRTDNGIVEIAVSGVSMYRYTTGATLVGDTVFFDWNDTPSAYTLSLSAFTGGVGDYLPLSGSAEMTGNFTAQTIYMDTSKLITAVGGGATLELGVKGNQNEARITTDSGGGGLTSMYFRPGEINSRVAGSYWLHVGTGNTTSDNSAQLPSILSSRNSKVNSGVANSVILGGNSLTASTSNTVYVPYLNVSNIGTGTSVYNLGIDADGNIVEGTGVISGDTTVGELSATSVSILNSGATSREYFDYSSNTVESGVTNSAIVGGSGNTISSGLRNVFVSGVDLTAYSSDTAYFSNVTLGGSIRNLSQFNVDVNGLEVISVGTGLTSTANVNTYGTIISSRDSRINPGVVNSAVIAATGRTASANNTLYTENLNVNGTTVGIPCDLSFAISDETTAITTGTTKLTIYAPYAFTITNVYASLSTSGSTGSQFDVNKNGTTIFSTPITIDANEFHSNDAATPPVITGTTVAQFDKLTVDIDTAGTAAAGAKIYILGKRT